jgi:hypothetical protein
MLNMPLSSSSSLLPIQQYHGAFIPLRWDAEVYVSGETTASAPQRSGETTRGETTAINLSAPPQWRDNLAGPVLATASDIDVRYSLTN